LRISCLLRLSATLFAALAATVAVAACGSSNSTPKAVIPAPSRLVAAGHLTYCSDMEYPAEISRPFGKPVGYDADVGIKVANEFGLTPVFVQTPFASIFTALDAGKCDAIINSVTITPQRQRAFYMVPYGQYGFTILVQKGNPKHITTVGLDLCGLSAGGPLGSNYIPILQGADRACQRAGKPGVHVVAFPTDDAGVASLAAGKLDAYLEDVPPAHRYLAGEPDALQAGGATSQSTAPMGIVVARGNPQMRAAIQKAVNALYANGAIPGMFSR
jgi:polar amino acid transport system substrate-binding protein